MKFYGYGIVWDKEQGKPLCKFQSGELETEDKKINDTLKVLGYKHDEPENNKGEIDEVKSPRKKVK